MVVDIFLAQMWPSIKILIAAPFKEPSLLWQIAPILLIWVVMEFYFGTHKKETLGWNTALGNGLSLFWINIAGITHLFSDKAAKFMWGPFIVLLVITIYALFVIYVSFEHVFSAKWTYFLTTPNITYYFSIIAILYSYGTITLNGSMLIAILILWLLIFLLELPIKWFMPELKEDNKDSSDTDFSNDKSPSDSFDSGLDSISNSEPSTMNSSFDETTSTNETNSSLDSDSSPTLGGLENSIEDSNFDKDFKL